MAHTNSLTQTSVENSEQIAHHSSELLAAINTLEEISQENNEHIQETSTITKKINEEAKTLNDKLNTFTT
jgi:methyl-accepting chemotaxis protein